MSNSNDVNVTLKYLEVCWQNIQHNERLRNNLFNLYLVISGVFLFFLSKTPLGIPLKQILFVAALFVWVIGLAFLWSYSRFRHIIGRDAKIVKSINRLFHDKNQLEDAIWEEYKQFYEVLESKGVLRFGSVGWCVTTSTSLISAIILSIGIWQLAGLKYSLLFILILLVFLLNQLIFLVFERLWGSRKRESN
jgi:hypothetical protein